MNRIDKILDAEREWQVFYFEAQNTGKPMASGSRCVRVNMDLGKDPPPLDAKQQLSNLQSQVIQLLRTPEYQNIIEQIAHRLVASAFYFSKDSVGPNKNGTLRCSGKEHGMPTQEISDDLQGGSPVALRATPRRCETTCESSATFYANSKHLVISRILRSKSNPIILIRTRSVVMQAHLPDRDSA